MVTVLRIATDGPTPEPADPFFSAQFGCVRPGLIPVVPELADMRAKDLVKFGYIRPRLWSAMEQIRVTTLRELSTKDENDVTGARQVGEVTVRRLREALAKAGLAFQW